MICCSARQLNVVLAAIAHAGTRPDKQRRASGGIRPECERAGWTRSSRSRHLPSAHSSTLNLAELTSVSIRHTVSDERVLELGAHEPITVAGPVEHHEVDLEHEHVKYRRHDDEPHCAGEEVLDPHSGRHLEVSKQQPQLSERAKTDGSDREQPDPFTAECRAEAQAREHQVLPPLARERLSLRVEVGEPDPEVHSERGEEDEVGVEQDETGLGNEGVVESDEEGTEDGRRERHAEREEREEGKRDEREAEHSREETHDGVGYSRLKVVPTREL